MVPLQDYCTGLLLPGERKASSQWRQSPRPAHTAAKHQSLLHFVAIAPWSDEAVLAKVRQLGRQDNCQAVVSLSLANHHASLPIAHGPPSCPRTWG
jgi:SRSO17 transposase